MLLSYIADSDHYAEVIKQVQSVRRSLWIGTADIKDLYVEERPFLAMLADLLEQDVEVKLIHAKEPGPNFLSDFDRYPILSRKLQRVLCPRVHFKLVIFDYRLCYIGSANLTGAGMGAKSKDRRNFEAGILTDVPSLVDQAVDQFDAVFSGSCCQSCQRRDICGDPIR